MVSNFRLTEEKESLAEKLFSVDRQPIEDKLCLLENEDASNISLIVNKKSIELAKVFIDKEWSQNYLRSFILNPSAYKPALNVSSERINFKRFGDRSVVSYKLLYYLYCYILLFFLIYLKY